MRAPVRWWQDVQVLGRTAPRRAAHEAAVRTGWWGRKFERAARGAERSPLPSAPLPLGPPAPVPPRRAAATLEAAAAIAQGGPLTVFGRPVDLDPALAPGGDWHRCPMSAATWPARTPWWEVDVRSADRPADVKWVWEPARHHHFVLLARAAHLSPGGDEARALARGIDGWLRAVQHERGVHWLSNLEISLRALAWLQVLALAPEALGPDLRRRVDADLQIAAGHLSLDLPRTSLSMANNHLVGDLVGLAALRLAFGDRPGAEAADRMLVRHLQHEVRDDGSMIEESLSYHRFVLDLLALRVLAGSAPAEVTGALARGAQLLFRLGAGAGPLPQHGDWDEGRALVTTAPVHDLRGSALLGLALGGGGAPEAWRAEHDQVAWHAPPGDPVPPDPAEQGGHDVGGGTARTAVGPWTVWLRATGGGWHGHADHTSVVIHHGPATVVGDPGTGSYNGDDRERHYFRSSMAHDVLRLDGHDQLEPHRQFRWRHEAPAAVGAPLHHAGGVASWAVHGAYTRLTPARRVVRVAWTTADAVVVADWVYPSPGPWELSLPLHPDSVLTGRDLEIQGGQRLVLHPPADGASPAPVLAGSSWSPTYGTTVPSVCVDARGDGSGRPVAWAVGVSGTPAPDTLPDGSVQHLGTTLRVHAGPSGARLEVGPAGGPPSASAELPWPSAPVARAQR